MGIQRYGKRNLEDIIANPSAMNRSELKSALEARGSTIDRPSGLGFDDVGQTFFDTDIGIPLWWSGDAWVDADGTSR